MLGRRYRNREATAAVRIRFENDYPDLLVNDVWLQAHEADRDVVAVIYRNPANPHVPVGMPPYKLFAIRRDTLATEELEATPGSPYALRGIK